MEDDIGSGAEAPVLFADAECETGRAIGAAGIEFGIRIFTGFAGDADVTGTDEGTAFLAAAEALGMEEAFELHGTHVIPGAGIRG